MRTVTTLITAIVVGTLSVPAGATPNAQSQGPVAGEMTPEPALVVDAVPAADRLALIGHTQEQGELVDDLLDRFATAALELPPLTITFTENGHECFGRDGLHHPMGDITICKPTRFTVAHEIAHAWAAYNLTDADREAYRQLWDAPTWGSHEIDWGERATETAANTIAWALLLDTPNPAELFRSHLCTYQALTGNPLPQSLTTPCPTVAAEAG